MTIAQRVASRYLQANAEEEIQVSLVALVSEGEMLGISDDTQRGVQPAFWLAWGLTPPYSLFLLEGVPLPQAEQFVDHFGLGGFKFRSNAHAWSSAKAFVTRRLKTVR